jgi:hypothetical protein
MTVSYNPSIAVQNLAFLVDTANPKSYTNGENLFINSEKYSGYSSAGNFVIFPNTSTVVTPAGTTASSLLVNVGVTNYSQISQGYFTTAPGYYTISYYFRPASTSTVSLLLGTQGYDTAQAGGLYFRIVLDLSSRAFRSPQLVTSTTASTTTVVTDFSYSAVDAGSGWTRCSVTTNLTTATPFTSVYGGFYSGIYGQTLASTGTGVYTWGWQLEASSTVTNYVPTTTTISPRSLTWTDLTGRGNNLSINSYVLYTANLGQAMATGVFTTNSSTQSFAYIPQQFFNTSSATNVSYALMINANWAANQYYQTLIGMQSSAFAYVATLNMDQGVSKLLCVDFRTPSASDRSIITYDMTAYINQWCLITYTFNAGQHTLYINNQQVAQATGVNTRFPNWPAGVVASGYAIGTNIDSGRPIGDAKISWSAVYNKTLSLAEVTQNYNALRGRYGI